MSAAPQWRVQVDEVVANLERFGVTARESQHHQDRLAVELSARWSGVIIGTADHGDIEADADAQRELIALLEVARDQIGCLSDALLLEIARLADIQLDNESGGEGR